MKSKYQKYYDKLKNQLFSSYISRYTSTISTVKSKINSISNSISSNSTNWNEKGLNTIQNNTIPVIIKNVSNVENGINALSQAVAKSYNLLSKLTELDSVCKKYDSSLEEDKLKYENQIAFLENQIDSIIDEINSISITSTNINKNNFVESSDDVNIVSNINSVNSNISTKKIDFLGNVDDLTQYTVADNYKTIRKVMTGFDNTTGEIVKENSTIHLKPGETRVITIKLPTNTGAIAELKRTTADGDSVYRTGKVVTSLSNVKTNSDEIDYVNYKNYSNHYPKDTDLHTNYYDWIITANGSGNTTIEQTCEYTTKDDPNWYAEAIYKLNIIVDS